MKCNSISQSSVKDFIWCMFSDVYQINSNGCLYCISGLVRKSLWSKSYLTMHLKSILGALVALLLCTLNRITLYLVLGLTKLLLLTATFDKPLIRRSRTLLSVWWISKVLSKWLTRVVDNFVHKLWLNRWPKEFEL